MVTTRSGKKNAVAEEIAVLEAEVERVIALETTPVGNRADLVERLTRLKTRAAMLEN